MTQLWDLLMGDHTRKDNDMNAFFDTAFPHVVHTPADLATIPDVVRERLISLTDDEIAQLSALTPANRATWFVNLCRDKQFDERKAQAQALFVGVTSNGDGDTSPGGIRAPSAPDEVDPPAPDTEPAMPIVQDAPAEAQPPLTDDATDSAERHQ